MRVLVVEDHEDLRDILMKQLADHGYAVDGCGDGETGWDYLSAADYDIVILDIGLPGMNGMELLTRIRQAEMDVQVLMLTAWDTIDDKVKGLDAGADDYMTKPFAN